MTEESFIFRSPITADQKETAITESLANIEENLAFIATYGYDEFSRQRAGILTETEVQEQTAGKAKENLGTAFEGTPRDYQIFMLEKAKEESVICHLGTGMGKTLISIMLIKEFLSRKIQNKVHILFIVPSVALAIQHTDTLRANLPCVVETACHTNSNSDQARSDIASADVVVATHGAALDLLRHYPDILSMSKVKLMIMDECHYATGNHNYATILEKFYHTLPRDHRPRVLGLTASPLINVALKTSEAELQSMLSRFEDLMDAKLYGFPMDKTEIREMGVDRIRPILNLKEAEESVISYNSTSDEYELSKAFPSWENLKLHKSRAKELEQLKYLCSELGLCVTAIYTEKLAKEVNRNEFEKETPAQHKKLIIFLGDSVRILKDAIAYLKSHGHDGHTTKMRMLENLLTKEVQPWHSHSAPVGVCFCERRITALALSAYYSERRKVNGEESDGAIKNALGSGVTSHTSLSDSSCGRFNDVGSDDSMDGRFDDAEGDNSLPLAFDRPPVETRLQVVPIKPDFVVRHATQIFKYLARNHRMNHQKILQLEEDWMHQSKRIREVIAKLRRRETNVLFATSVVEEGVDVEACSFIVSFDGLKTIKSYIQMKGRARMKHAKFFVFSDENETAVKTISLENAQFMERFIHQFILKNERKSVLDRLSSMPCHTSSCFECEEEKALHEEEYTTPMGNVDLLSSKSLLNRFALSAPLDPNSRTSKDANTLHMPMYTNDKLLLPAHIPPDQREVKLPSIFLSQNKKKKHALLALAACVRLHKMGLLNERLLPLSDIDMKSLLLERALIDLPSAEKVPRPLSRAVDVYIYQINQSGYVFGQHEVDFVSRGKSLALLSTEPLPGNIPRISFTHRELGQVDCSLDYCQDTRVCETQWKNLALFHSILFNVRWRRRRRRKASTVFCFDESHFCDKPFPCYVVGCLQKDNSIDWSRILGLIRHYLSPPEAKQDAVQNGKEKILFPTIWNPTYAPNVTYIVYGPAGKTCQDSFPSREYSSYREYYATKYCVDVDPLGEMFSARRMFDFPQSFISQISLSDSVPKDHDFVEIARELCTGGEINDPFIMLHLILLPQILYHIDRHLTAMAFKRHCTHNFKNLGKCLSQMSTNSVLEALTAKSCAIEQTYDRLEWLGDGVLKLLQTDALLTLPWTCYLHEGYLSMLRSAMGSNDRLKDAAKASGIDEFILILPLSRSCWTPCGLRLHDASKSNNNNKRHVFMKKCDTREEKFPSEKVYADVVEAILGLIYIKFGIEDARIVACELGVSFTHGRMPFESSYVGIHVDPTLLSFSQNFLGVERFNNTQLLVEATTHQTCLHKPVPSYQRLEWVGDAVLCLAAREWLFCRDDNRSTSVGELVVLESTLVCNEALAYIGFTKGLHRLIDHRDAKLPGHFSEFEFELRDNARGLWGTDPPKVIPDVVEALIGAVHIDLGFNEGQRAALHVIKPMTGTISRTAFKSIDACFLHPKQHLFEMAGTLVSVKAYTEEVFLRLQNASQYWKCNRGKNSNQTNSKCFGVVRCRDIIIAVARESTNRAAVNVACALAVEVLKANPQIIDRLREIIVAK